MNEVSTNPITQVIIFHDGSKKFITEPQASLIFQVSAGQTKSITTPNLGMITFSSIAKIISIDDFYEQYPEQRPEYRQEWKEQPVEPYQTLEEQALATERGRNGLIKGLEQFIREAESRGESTVNAQEILNNYKENKLTEGTKKEKAYYRAIVDKYKNVQRNPSEEAHYNFALKKCQTVNMFNKSYV